MLIDKNSLFFNVRGKVGGLVYFSRNGNTYAKKAPGPRKTPPSEAQLKQQARFSLLTQFFKPIVPLLNILFEKYTDRMSAFNKAVSVNKHIITGEYPDYAIDCTQLILGEELRSYEVPYVCSADPGTLLFVWDKRIKTADDQDPGLVFLAAYCAELKQWIYKLFPDVVEEISAELEVKPFSGYSVFTFTGFESGRRVQLCDYTGLVKIL